MLSGEDYWIADGPLDVRVRANAGERFCELLAGNGDLKFIDSDDETVAVPLRNASIINDSTADLLIGYSVEGRDGDQTISGTVESVKWNAAGVMLNIIKSDGESAQLPLEGLTKIY